MVDLGDLLESRDPGLRRLGRAGSAGAVLTLFLGIGWFTLGAMFPESWPNLAGGVLFFVGGALALGGNRTAGFVTAVAVFGFGLSPLLHAFAGTPVPPLLWIVSACHALAGTLLYAGVRAMPRARGRPSALALKQVFD